MNKAKKTAVAALIAGALAVGTPAVAFASTAPDGAAGAPGGASVSHNSGGDSSNAGGIFQLRHLLWDFLARLENTPASHH